MYFAGLKLGKGGPTTWMNQRREMVSCSGQADDQHLHDQANSSIDFPSFCE
jgi:hypothetical protein